MEKTYTLELTAQEVWALSGTRLAGSAQLRDVRGKLARLDEQARADRDVDDLRLPWAADTIGGGRWGVVVVAANGAEPAPRIERAAKLMAAAPELLEALTALNDYVTRGGRGCVCQCPVTDGHTSECVVVRAFRKVETGVPEEP